MQHLFIYPLIWGLWKVWYVIYFMVFHKGFQPKSFNLKWHENMQAVPLPKLMWVNWTDFAEIVNLAQKLDDVGRSDSFWHVLHVMAHFWAVSTSRCKMALKYAILKLLKFWIGKWKRLKCSGIVVIWHLSPNGLSLQVIACHSMSQHVNSSQNLSEHLNAKKLRNKKICIFLRWWYMWVNISMKVRWTYLTCMVPIWCKKSMPCWVNCDSCVRLAFKYK